jgi:hypothetical protein
MGSINTPPFIKFKYTSGNEYALQQNSKNYQGYYFEFKDEVYAGKEFNLDVANKLVKIYFDINNPLDVYEIASGAKIPRSQVIPSIPFHPSDEDFSKGNTVRYFVKKISKNDIIVETNVSTFKEVQSNPLYQTLEVNYSFGITEEELNELDKKMSGLKAFIQDYTIPTSSDETIITRDLINKGLINL